jgi:ferritin-like metal-binding protein YciE
MTLNSMQDVLAHEIKDLYNAESQLVKALPKMAEAASSPELTQAIRSHLKETKDHVRRLEKVAKIAGVAPRGTRCQAMAGLIAEGEKVISERGEPNARDVALISAAQRVEHYEIAGYGTAKTLAKELNLSEAERLLGETLDEESAADEMLSKIATGGLFGKGLNQQLAR